MGKTGKGKKSSFNLGKVLIGSSNKIKKIREQISAVSGSKSVVLITGESGTGKEIVANAVHQMSNRYEKTYGIVDCSTLPRDDKAHSKLFGHLKGSFTGASKNTTGIIEEADHGTVFLDEVDDLPLDLQPHFLRVIQEGQIMSLGGTDYINVDVRIVVATKKDLADLVRVGKFRSDLFYRLNVLKIDIPPLRERKSDIKQLANHFIAKENEKLEEPSDFKISERQLDVLKSYNWPGNVRELSNIIERAIGQKLSIEEIVKPISPQKGSKLFSVEDLQGINIPTEILSKEDMSKTEATERFVVWLYLHRNELDFLGRIFKTLHQDRQGFSKAALKQRIGISRPFVHEVFTAAEQGNSIEFFFINRKTAKCLKKYFGDEMYESPLLVSEKTRGGPDILEIKTEIIELSPSIYDEIADSVRPSLANFVDAYKTTPKKRPDSIRQQIVKKINEWGIRENRNRIYDRLDKPQIKWDRVTQNLTKLEEAISAEEVRLNCLYYHEASCFHFSFVNRIELLIKQVNQGEFFLSRVIHADFTTWIEDLEELLVFIKVRGSSHQSGNETNIVFGFDKDSRNVLRDELWVSIKVNFILKACNHFQKAIWKFRNILLKQEGHG